MKNDSGKGWKKRSLHAFSRCHNGNDAAKKGGGGGWREREGGEGRERYLGDVRVKSLCCSRCYPVSPFQESRIMRPIVPGCCFCGRYGSSCATSYSWNVFAYSLMRIPSSPHSLLSLSPASKHGDVKAFALKHQLSTYFQKSDFYVHLGETFDRSVSVDVERE